MTANLPTRRLRLFIAFLASACALALAPAAEAHGPPAELAFWGGFVPEAARCQRVISRATSLCVSQAAAARGRCLASAMRGGACDETALDAVVDAARARALDRVEAACSPDELQHLGYVGLGDALQDVVTACRRLDIAATSAAFGPVMVGGSVGSAGDPKAACVEAGTREATRLLRFGMRTYAKVLDRIAALNLSALEKQRLVAWAERRIGQQRTRSRAALTAACEAEDFARAYDRSVDTYLDDIAAQAACMQEFVYVQDTVRCPTPACGNGVEEPGEECDDGNDFEGDGCRADCAATQCDAFDSTYALIQQAVVTKYGCTAGACHGSLQAGGLDLRPEQAAAQMYRFSAVKPEMRRIEPGAPQNSLLFLKLASKTLPEQYDHEELGSGSPMPIGDAALTQDELEAVRRWIVGGAPTTGTVPDVAELLNGCTPEPEPIEITPLEPPAFGEGVQLHMPPWTVDAQSEHEVCFATYYDVSAQVPEAMRGPNDTFCYNVEHLRQDPLSHHLIVNRYIGAFAPEDPSWGPYRCAGGPRQGESCVPTELGSCGAGGECATTPVIQVGCDGIGPPDPGRASVAFAGAQQANATNRFPDGAYRCVPLRGTVLWNSHAFNLTDRAGKLEAWINFIFAKPAERRYAAQGIFDTSSIFYMNVPACEQQEICDHHVLPQNSNLFELTSHMHQRGKLWRTYRGRFRCAGEETAQGDPVACDPLNPTQCQPGNACADRDGSEPMSRLLYTNFVYNDPVQLRFDPPLLFTGERPDRTLTFCALYDNGFTDPATMKRQSTSPLTPWGTPSCAMATTCYSGKVCEPCSGSTPEERNRSCDSSPGAGDGLCDGCTLTGGVTTEDEMFLLLGSFYRTTP